jgi:hypothetical protein
MQRLHIANAGLAATQPSAVRGMVDAQLTSGVSTPFREQTND